MVIKQVANLFAVALAIPLLLISSCKEREEQFIPDNEALVPHRISTIRVENYVNRVYIDLIGRSPVPDELQAGVELLRSDDLSFEVRSELIRYLQEDTTFRDGDISYKDKYYQRLYDIIKSRMVEGAADVEFARYVGLANNAIFRGRLVGDSIQVFAGILQKERNQRVIDSRVQFMEGEIDINEVFARMLDNNVYDVINMNTFNFVNASYDDLFYRFPTQKEFGIAYSIIQNNEVGNLFGGFASNKREYCLLLCNSAEFYEGLINWAYLSLMGREPSTQEMFNLYEDLVRTGRFPDLQHSIMVTDEYADFF